MQPTEPQNPDADFRDQAVEVSRKLIAQIGQIDPSETGLSLCLPTDDDGKRLLRRYGYGLLVRTVLGFGGLVGGALVIFTQENPTGNGDVPVWWLVIGTFLTFTGIAVLGSAAFASRIYLRRVRRQELRKLKQLSPGGKVWAVGIEDANTFQKMKVVGEDIGWLVCDPANRQVVIEGLRYRYVIHADDTDSVDQVRATNSTGVEVSYRVGEFPIAITISTDSLWREFRRQLGMGGGVHPLAKEIARTLGKAD